MLFPNVTTKPMTFSLSGQRNCLIISPLSSLSRQTTAVLNTSPGNALYLPAFCLLTRVKSRRLGSEERHQIDRRPGLSALAPTSGGACDLEVHNRAIQIIPPKVERLDSYRLQALCFGPARVSYHGVVRYHAQWKLSRIARVLSFDNLVHADTWGRPDGSSESPPAAGTP